MTDVTSTATISGCGLYRYELTRTWNAALPALGFCMLNPSTADGSVDDPTIRKCRGFAARNGFGGIVVVNLFAFRATKPADMRAAADPIGPMNDAHLRTAAAACSVFVLAWGTAGGKLAARRANAVVPLLAVCPSLVTIGARAKDGSPRHPLMLPYADPLLPFPLHGAVS